ncbi:hypothetical protein pRALTA_0236 (plasmid) [Cupriavidus taiwanensis LMG 19424]|uniref:Uncharacterized protein n=3 Tax=Cupriavidus TaxID=106589 RepID=B2AK87_CUPTR|nr:hypothetical protein pRALTA_0236 [Cupriavidus taiwanensis LMG 19424]SPC24885.1 conserved hypothetical protein [Cupriavidus taiwanensis]SPD62235.1 conserved protein of unknown function [Cupriavidus neocaledonicus]SPD37244.1 conserved protein of unknown function [Cupriavidus taiwanensis]SPD61524.1 conserved protein of unknown function [Cupriavidus taiwanensis]
MLSRGYVVAEPMMRGYGNSEGYLRRHGCDAVASGMDAAKDVNAVIGYLKKQPYVDSAKDTHCRRERRWMEDLGRWCVQPIPLYGSRTVSAARLGA